eukprot:CAMPEP_0197302506 /NCGR_PEP_ID=MMETSP0890-20130614/51093_1 /TAXON_ID=44058 ORGANISM="Aureoumbra lagunensis, Strain CCMP1510" /NCGR_SAMPLE_ID=MMETSP0890 /ASSEMBLY_ACC=CAM_ASM_000533 /LENGTH=248 /DNA_ID=CAMNT_0042782127 /DNA_START=1 /DNA_END=747 /DNA_ORIENTATION=-
MDELFARIRERIDATAERAMPYTILSYAQSLDGSIALHNSDERLILSSEASMRMTHMLRNSCDAIAIGIGTALKDDPRLTVRFGEVQHQPAAIVFDSSLRLPTKSKLAQTSDKRRVILVCKGNRTELLSGELFPKPELRSLVEILTVAQGDLRSALLALKKVAGFKSIMIEGGARMIQSAIKIADDTLLTIAPIFVPGGLRAVDSFSSASKDLVLRLTNQYSFTLNNDTIIYGHLPSLHHLEFDEEDE